MKYAYNGNLDELDRIKLVINEIINEYPQIKIEDAKEAAMLEGKISEDKNIDMEFNRLYNIMLVTSNNKEIVGDIYPDLIKLLNNNKTNEKIDYYCTVALEISKYLIDERNFPYLSEF